MFRCLCSLPLVTLALLPGCRLFQWPSHVVLTDEHVTEGDPSPPTAQETPDLKVTGVTVHGTFRDTDPITTMEAHGTMLFNREYRLALQDLRQAHDFGQLDLAEAKLQAIHGHLPERTMVNTIITNGSGEDLVCRIYPVGSQKEFVSVLVPAGVTTTEKLREGLRYRTVWIDRSGTVRSSREYNSPAYEGIKDWVGYKN